MRTSQNSETMLVVYYVKLVSNIDHETLLSMFFKRFIVDKRCLISLLKTLKCIWGNIFNKFVKITFFCIPNLSGFIYEQTRGS